MPDLIPPLLWPPNSPDLNPVDYTVWGCAPGASLQREDPDCGGVAAAHYGEWAHLEKRVIDNAAKQWHKRL